MYRKLSSLRLLEQAIESAVVISSLFDGQKFGFRLVRFLPILVMLDDSWAADYSGMSVN